jgi:predicted SprT family Zn-dependent metalloprotease
MDEHSYIRSLARRWGEPMLSGVGFMTNPKLTRSAGRWLPSRNIIQLSAATMNSPTQSRREVLCHEAAHAVVWARYGRKAKPHGPEWQALMRQAGFEPRASLIRCGQRTEPKTGQTFRHTCSVCQFSKRAKRRMPRWRCPECRAAGLEGALRIERVRTSR